MRLATTPERHTVPDVVGIPVMNEEIIIWLWSEKINQCSIEFAHMPVRIRCMATRVKCRIGDKMNWTVVSLAPQHDVQSDRTTERTCRACDLAVPATLSAKSVQRPWESLQSRPMLKLWSCRRRRSSFKGSKRNAPKPRNCNATIEHSRLI